MSGHAEITAILNGDVRWAGVGWRSPHSGTHPSSVAPGYACSVPATVIYRALVIPYGTAPCLSDTLSLASDRPAEPTPSRRFYCWPESPRPCRASVLPGLLFYSFRGRACCRTLSAPWCPSWLFLDFGSPPRGAVYNAVLSDPNSARESCLAPPLRIRRHHVRPGQEEERGDGRRRRPSGEHPPPRQCALLDRHRARVRLRCRAVLGRLCQQRTLPQAPNSRWALSGPAKQPAAEVE